MEVLMEAQTKFSRKDLYELVWSEPQKLVAARLGIKTWHLTFLCKKHDIPRPESGYPLSRLAMDSPLVRSRGILSVSFMRQKLDQDIALKS